MYKNVGYSLGFLEAISLTPANHPKGNTFINTIQSKNMKLHWQTLALHT